MMNRTITLLTLFGALFLVAACSTDDGETSGGGACTTHDDCPNIKEFCVDGTCQVPGCTSDEECPAGFVCLAGGTCQKDVECQTDEDCPPGKTCENYQCLGSECSPSGTTVPCFIGCHEGQKACIDGEWTDCDAPPVLDGEVCNNGIDDNCNGVIDEGCVQCTEADSPIPCTSPCGEGFQHCEAGIWGECDAPTDCLCDEPGVVDEVACGKCGYMSRTCSQVEETTLYMWDNFGPCLGEGLCAPGDEEETNCGLKCGTQIRICTDECTWSEWSECEGEGLCIPGQTKDKECGNCGLQSAVCGENCAWEPWGECQEDAGCTLGESETQDCGNCGLQTRYCESNCVWGDWGPCQNEGVCGPGEKETEPCGFCGVKERTCTNSCTWGAYGSCQEGGECDPGESQSQSCGPNTEKGICEKGTQTRTCNNACMWNSWGSCYGAVYPQNEVCGDGIDQNCDGDDLRQPDQYEPNNSCGTCTWISGDDPEVTLYASFDTGGLSNGGDDTNDYFCFKAVDNFNIWPTAEHMKIDLINQPIGIDGDLHLYKGYSACTSDDAIASSVAIGGTDEHIDWEETGDDDTATYYLRVENWSTQGNCSGNYTLKIQGLK